MASKKINRSKAREYALQVLFCQQFTDRQMAIAMNSVEASHTIRGLQETLDTLKELSRSVTAATQSVSKVLETLAEAAKEGEKKPIKPANEGTYESRLPLHRARTDAIQAMRQTSDLLRENQLVFGEDSFCGRLLATFDKNRNRVDSVLGRALEGWTTRRLTAEDHANLSLGVTELLYFQDVPTPVTINEYIELSKKYGDTDSTRLVNGVLDRVAKENPKESAKA